MPFKDYDFYAVQDWCDGFGNDIYTVAIFRKREKAIKYAQKHGGEYTIVGQYWGEYVNADEASSDRCIPYLTKNERN